MQSMGEKTLPVQTLVKNIRKKTRNRNNNSNHESQESHTPHMVQTALEHALYFYSKFVLSGDLDKHDKDKKGY